MNGVLLKTRWHNIDSTGYPPKDEKCEHNGRYSIPVLIGNSNTGQVGLQAFSWDYDMCGWVGYDLSEGPDPDDYEVQHVDHWAFWPKCKLVTLG